MPSYARTSSNVPTPLAVSWEVSPGTGNPGVAIQASNLAQGDSATILTKWNANALRLDYGCGYAPAPFGILWGLGLTGNASSLTLTIGEGWANIRGLVYRSATSTSVTASGWSAIWLNENGSISAEFNTLTAPGSYCTFLGTVTATSSGISDIDYSGRWTSRAGILYRRTADTGFPQDTPGMPVLTETAFGTYYWDGVEHRQHNDADALYFTANGAIFGKHTSLSYFSYTGSGTITLGASSSNIQYITPTADMSVNMPSSAVINPGMWFECWNNAATGSGFDISVYSSTGSGLIATVTPQSFSVLRVKSSAGVYSWTQASSASSTGMGGGPL